MSLENNFLNSEIRKHIEKNKYFLESFNELINNYSDEIPDKMLDGSMEVKNYKVRTNWFSGVVSLLDYVRELLPEEFNLKLRSFIKSFKERREGSNEVRTTREEIDTAISLLNEAKNILNKKE